MKLEQLFGSERDRAVSPVIGVVLMLTATVIIGGVVAAFVTGFGSGLSNAPQASYDFDYDGTDNLTITHEGGESIPGDELEVRVNGNSSAVDQFENGTVSTGSEVTINASDTDTVRVVWVDPDGDQTSTLAKWEGSES